MCQSIQVNSRLNFERENGRLGICSTTYRMQIRRFNRSARSRLLRASLLATTSLAAMVLPAQAQTVWEGTTSGDWFTGSNWSTGAVPTAGDDVQLPTRDPNLTDVSRGNAEANNVSLSGSGGLVIWNEGTLSSSLGYISTDESSYGGGVNVVGGNGTAIKIRGSSCTCRTANPRTTTHMARMKTTIQTTTVSIR